MYCRSVFLLLILFVAVVTSQNTTRACIDAANALDANQSCSRAFIALSYAISQNTSISAGVDLDAYCAADCRDLVNRQITACDDENDDGAAAFLSLTSVVCATDPDGMSCADYLYSQRSRFEEVYNNFTSETSGMCPFEMPEQGCSSACQTAIQNSVTNGGCCVQYLLQFGSDESFKELIARCDIDYSRGGTCVESGGDTSQNTTACTDAENALEANQNCYRASTALRHAIIQNTSISAGVDIDAYCAADCRNLVNRQITACNDEDEDGVAAFLSLTPVVCTTDADGTSCGDYITGNWRTF